MPGLIAFKRRWSTGSDDFVVPAFMLFILHVVLFIVIAIILGTSEDLDRYGNIDIEALRSSPTYTNATLNRVICAHKLRNFSFGYLALIAIAALIEVAMGGFSMQGTILHPEPRKPLEYVLYIRIAFGVIEMLYSIVTLINLSQAWECDVLHDIYNICIGIAVVYIIVFIIVLLVGYCVFDASGGKFYKVKNAYHRDYISNSRIEEMRTEYDAKSQKTWLNRLSNYFCCVSNNKANIKQVALDEVSTLLSQFFKDYDLVMSDIIAGLTLLRHKQQCKENNTTLSGNNETQEFMCGRPITPGTNFVDLENEVNRAEYEEMIYYGAYALAAYGPLFHWIENSATGLCGVLHECLCGENPTYRLRCCGRRDQQFDRYRTVVRGDPGCGWALAGIQKSMLEHGLEAEIVYLSTNNDVYEQPFFVSVDHKKKAIVVTVRGTLGEADALTDLVASVDTLDCDVRDRSWKGHKGMVKGAEYVKKLLMEKEMVLSLGFGHNIEKGTKDYNLVLVGHSLGAGIASILALLLRPIYPNLKCFAYSPPGGLLSHSAMEATKDLVKTLVFGKDVVPRAGLPQLESLRNDVIELLKHTDLPKYKIILGNLCGSLKHRHGLLRAERHSSRALRVASKRVNSVTNDTTTSALVSSLSEELYPPGKIYHLVYSSAQVEGCSSKVTVPKKYYLVEADNVTDFKDIIVSHQMISHHLPQEVLKCMKKALNTNVNERLDRAYAQSATLPFAETKAGSMQQKRILREQEKSKTLTTSEQPLLTNDHASLEPSSPAREDDADSSNSAEPFLNSNQNHNTDPLSQTNTSSELHEESPNTSQSVFVRMPVPAPRRSLRNQAVLEVEVEPTPAKRSLETENSQVNETQINLSPLDAPQASSTPFMGNKSDSEEEYVETSSFLAESNAEDNEQTPNFSSCEDVNVDMTGRSAIS